MFKRIKNFFERMENASREMPRILQAADGLRIRLDLIERRISAAADDTAWRKLDESLNQELGLLREKISMADRMNQETMQILQSVRKATALEAAKKARALSNLSRLEKSIKLERRSR